MVKLVKTRMRNDHHAALSQQRLVAVHIEVIPERHHLHEQRIERRIDVVRRNVGNARDQNVALAFDRDLVLLIILFENFVVDRLGLCPA